jgi:serine protease Do
MDMKSIIEQYKKTVIQIATPYSTGTGFYLADCNLIVTNEHVIRDNKFVVIDGEGLEKQMVEVLYMDQKYDLAFLAVPAEHSMPVIFLRDTSSPLAEGEEIIAVGHPFGLKYTVTKGIISNTLHEVSGINYIQHDAALNPGNSGGPLISRLGKIVGVNTFIIKNGNSVGFSLPARYLEAAIEDFQVGKGVQGVRCVSCAHLVFENTIKEKYCPHCGSQITMISQIDTYEPTGISRSIEEMLVEMGYDIDLSRMGPSNWSVNRGSAKINIAYHEKSGLITGDAYLATLPEGEVLDLYTFLLQQNYGLEGLTFSVKGQDIILSLLIFDHYMDQYISKKLFDHLIVSADHYDDILVDRFGAVWAVGE